MAAVVIEKRDVGAERAQNILIIIIMHFLHQRPPLNISYFSEQIFSPADYNRQKTCAL